MLVAISGVGGTGKTSVAELLVKALNKKIKSRKQKYKLIVLNKLAEKKKAYIGFDEARRAKIVKMGELKKEVKLLTKQHTNMVLEGHFSHMFHADIVIVLRCKPTVLERRLRKKYKWPTKITENVEAEMIGLITDEALPLHAPGSIFEIDTTKRTARQTAKTIEKIVKNEGYARVKQMAGKIDWLRQI
jgi:adenylate kinase